MAITYDDNRPINYHDYRGESTDNKPTNCAVNSTFYELDTDKKFFFDGDTWYEIGKKNS